MSNRPKGFGLTAEVANKREANFKAENANEAINWMKDVLDSGSDEAADVGAKLSEVSTSKEVATQLKDGVALCHLVNVIKPGSVAKINSSSLAFKQMENIELFLTAAESLGLKKLDLFQVCDLYESQNIPQVINGIYAVGRKSRSHFDGPTLGPEESTENKRVFTDEQLRAGEGMIGLQAGSNKGASQAGQNFGKTRAIID